MHQIWGPHKEEMLSDGVKEALRRLRPALTAPPTGSKMGTRAPLQGGGCEGVALPGTQQCFGFCAVGVLCNEASVWGPISTGNLHSGVVDGKTQMLAYRNPQETVSLLQSSLRF